jgi:hypothetical protein
MALVSQPSPLTPARQRAQALASSGDLAGARAVLERAVELGKVHLSEDDPDVLVTAYQLGSVLQQADDPAGARRVLEEAYAAGQWRLGDADPLMLRISHDIGVVAEELGNRHEARKAFARVAELGPAALGADHPAVARSRAYLGQDHNPSSVRPEAWSPRDASMFASPPPLVSPPRDEPPTVAFGSVSGAPAAPASARRQGEPTAGFEGFHDEPTSAFETVTPSSAIPSEPVTPQHTTPGGPVTSPQTTPGGPHFTSPQTTPESPFMPPQTTPGPPLMPPQRTLGGAATSPSTSSSRWVDKPSTTPRGHGERPSVGPGGRVAPPPATDPVWAAPGSPSGSESGHEDGPELGGLSDALSEPTVVQPVITQRGSPVPPQPKAASPPPQGPGPAEQLRQMPAARPEASPPQDYGPAPAGRARQISSAQPEASPSQAYEPDPAEGAPQPAPGVYGSGPTELPGRRSGRSALDEQTVAQPALQPRAGPEPPTAAAWPATGQPQIPASESGGTDGARDAGGASGASDAGGPPIPVQRRSSAELEPRTPYTDRPALEGGYPRFPAGGYPPYSNSGMAPVPQGYEQGAVAPPLSARPQPVLDGTSRDAAYRKRGMGLFAAIAAVLAAIIAVAALVFVLANRSGAHPEPSVPTLGGPPPSDVRLRDSGTEIEVSWRDPSDGTVSFMVAMGHPGEELKPTATLVPGKTSYELGALNPHLNYCFTVIAVYRGNKFATSPQTCTSRSSADPAPSTSK